MRQIDFDRTFTDLTGHAPLSWQRRLYEKLANAGIPYVIDLPTGLGKTMVMAIWLIARANGFDVPRRLIYVVDRRTVVDQATDLAEEFAYLLSADPKKSFAHDNRTPNLADRWNELSELRSELGWDLAVSTLRGQLADNREWSRDPSRPAIILGTVDLIGSALLFSGYRSSYKRRPLEAGLLGQDSLLVLDEAHLSKPFEKLVCAISDGGAFQQDRNGRKQGTPMRVIRMSATSYEVGDGKSFQLNTDPTSPTYDLWSKSADGRETNPIKARFEAPKRLTVQSSTDVIDSIATAADRIASDSPGSRIVIFVKSPKDVDAVRKALLKRDKGRETKIAQLTGTMRGLERDELVDLETPIKDHQHERRVMQRFLNAENDPSLGECFLLSTSAGEVGFDLNADHLVGDAAPLDSWIQRLGRVNRRGNGIAFVYVFAEAPAERKADKKDDADKHTFATACVKAIETLRRLPSADSLESDTRSGPIFDASPRALRSLAKPAEALTPPPTTVELTDILLDAWSMTSIIEPMPGRPEVASWLRGIADDLPQTTLAWRAELDLPGFTELDTETIEEWFDAHRVLTHETLSVPTGVAARWFLDRWDALDDDDKSRLRDKAVIVDRAGLNKAALGDLIEQLARKSGDTAAAIRNADLVLPASFGGIRRGVGLLDAAEPQLDQGERKKPPEEQSAILMARRDQIDVADVAPGRFRLRVIETITDGVKQKPQVIGNGKQPDRSVVFRIELESDDDRTVRLISYVPRREKPELGSGEPETLKSHVGKVQEAVDGIIKRIRAAGPELISNNVEQAARLAADYHDHGKARERWQRLLVFPTAGYTGPNEPMAKSGGEMKRDSRGYRHEFGSLREFTDAHSGKIDGEVFDLAMHLIATHHGRGRPHFAKGGFDPECEIRSDEIHIDSIRRFARLQRKYGWWRLAWLENLLRCADAMASANTEADDNRTGSEEGEA